MVKKNMNIFNHIVHSLINLDMPVTIQEYDICFSFDMLVFEVKRLNVNMFE